MKHSDRVEVFEHFLSEYTLSTPHVAWVALRKGCSYTVTSDHPDDQFILVYDLFATMEEENHRPQHPSFERALWRILENDPPDQVLGFGLDFDYTWQPDEDSRSFAPKGFDEVLIDTIENLGLYYQVCSAFVYPEEGKQVVTELTKPSYNTRFCGSEDNYESMRRTLSSSLGILNPANLHWVWPPRQSSNGPAVEFALGSDDRETFTKKSCSVLLVHINRGEVDDSDS